MREILELARKKKTNPCEFVQKSKMGKKKGRKATKTDLQTIQKKDDKSDGLKAKAKAKKKKKSKSANGEKMETKLKEAVFALGGDEEDLKLIAEVEEDEEVQEEAEFSTQARAELKDFIRNLGLDKKFQQGMPEPQEGDEVVESGESSEEDDSDDDDNDDQEEDLEDGPKESNQVNDVPKKGDKAGNYHFVKEIPNWKKCIIKSGQKWHEILPPIDEQEEESPTVSDYWMAKLVKYANTILDMEVENCKRQLKSSRDSELSYINTVLKTGALNDKISAYTVLLQNYPVQNLAALNHLINMVSLKSRRPCMLALDCLRDVFVSHILAPDRKLRNFEEQKFPLLQQLSGGNKETRDKYLMVWLFEHKLKEAYRRFLDSLDEVSKDKIEKTKTKTMSIILDLLVANPELEQELLSRLVNKLGDPVRTIAAKAMFHLSKLLECHPVMKLVVLKEVERILYRPHVSSKAQYYGICFLSQILLDRDEHELANRLINIYFSFFKANVKKGDIDSKLMSALLTGVNRAFPYAKLAKEKMEEQLKLIYRLVQMCPFNTSIQALTLLFQIMDSGDSATDRFYCSLYKKIAHPDFAVSSKQAIFLNVIFKAMKKDTVPNRILAFIKRLLQVCQAFTPSLLCGILFLVSEVIKVHSNLQLRQYFKSSLQTNFAEDDEEDEEHYEDVKEDDDDEQKNAEKDESDEGEEKPKIYSWIHKENVRGHKDTSEHDPYNRNPSYCGAEHSVLWELQILSKHFHPSVNLFAQTLIDGESIKYSGDPLQDFTLIRFLDRFVFRNPKKDPLKGKLVSVLNKRNLYVPRGVKALAPDSKEYVEKDENAIPSDELFLYKFFREKKLNKTEDEDSDANSVTSEDFNDFMDKLSTSKDKAVDIDFASNMKDVADSSEDESVDDHDEVSNSDMEALGGDMSSMDEEDSEPELDDDDGENEDAFQDLEEMASDGSLEEDEVAPPKKKKKNSEKSSKLENLLADAEQFTELVEECAINDIDLGGSGSVSNKEKASKKQLKWEMNRNGGKGRRGSNFEKKRNRKTKRH